MHDGQLTEQFIVLQGVRQGSVLSPMLFLIVFTWQMPPAACGIFVYTTYTLALSDNLMSVEQQAFIVNPRDFLNGQ